MRDVGRGPSVDKPKSFDELGEGDFAIAVLVERLEQLLRLARRNGRPREFGERAQPCKKLLSRNAPVMIDVKDAEGRGELNAVLVQDGDDLLDDGPLP